MGGSDQTLKPGVLLSGTTPSVSMLAWGGGRSGTGVITMAGMTAETAAERCARWFRVSSDGQDEQNQEREVDTHIEARGYEVERTFTLHDVSASKGEQEPALAEVVEDITAGRYSVVVVAHSSRLDRREDLDAQLSFVMAVRAAGGRVESVREPEFGKSDLAGRVITLLSQYSNAEYSRTLKGNVLAAKRRIADNGALDGRLPWGFASEGEKYARRLVPTPQGREYALQVFRRIIAGQSLATVARWLDSEGVAPAGIKKEREDGRGKSGKWWPRSIGQLIRNPVYMGLRVDSDGQTLHECEPLVDAATWFTAGARLDSAPKRGPVLKSNRCYLSGASRCRRCGGPMYRIRCGKLYYLRCTGTGPDRKSCGVPLVRLEVAEQLADKYLGSLRRPEYEVSVIPGNGAEIDAALARLDFERQQVARRGLSWDDEDRERARIRAEWEAVNATERTPGRRELTPTGETYGQRWRRLSTGERADWLRGEVTVYFAKGKDPDADAELDGVSLFVVWAEDHEEVT